MERRKLSWGGGLVIAVLLALLAAAVVYALGIWNSVDATMSLWGWAMLVLGIIVTFAVGAGLMFLVFYSARHDMDR